MTYQKSSHTELSRNGSEQRPVQRQHQQIASDSLDSHISTNSAMKVYHVYYTTSMLNLRLHLNCASGPCIYYGKGTCLTTKPQIQLLSGDSKSSPVVAVAKLQYTSRHVLLRVGNEDSLSWEEMHRDKNRLRRGDYEFTTTLGLDSRRAFTWKVDDHIAKTIYRCVDDTGRVVASLLSGGMTNWKKGAEIEVLEGLDTKLEHLVIVSALAIFAAEAGWSIFQGYGSGQNGSDSTTVGAIHGQ